MSDVHLEIPESAEACETLLKGLPGERVTPSYMLSRVKYVDYYALPNSTTTVCRIALDNGYSVLGESACVDPVGYNPEVGKRIAYDRAFQSLWPLFGFLLAERRHAKDPS